MNKNIANTKNWIAVKNRRVEISQKGAKLYINNPTEKNGIICYKKIFHKTHDEIKCEFYGEVLQGEAPYLKMVSEKRLTMHSMMINTTSYISFSIPRLYFYAIQVAPHSKVEISNITISSSSSYLEEKLDNFRNDILVLTPSYPSVENKYLSGFVHSRVTEYKKHGLPVDVAVVYESYTNSCKYDFEEINVERISYAELRTLLGRKKYKKVLIHFFDKHYFDVLEGCDISGTEVYIWVHGPETLYWDYPYFTTRYYSEPNEITEYQKKRFRENDKMIRRLNEMPNIKFVFVSNWIKNRSEQLINISFNNYVIIPNVIDTELFDYQEKDAHQMKKIFMLRRYDDINKYAVDVSVNTIKELSKRECFKELEFNIYGRGSAFDRLFRSIQRFDNVHFYKQFFSHEEISELHKKNGIALFPTRYDAQGVSMCEAGSSGLLVISSDNDAIKEFIPYEDGNIIETENYKKYADFIEKIIHDKTLFNKITRETRDKIVSKCSYDATVRKEIELIASEEIAHDYNYHLTPDGEPVLSIVIPSYNVEQYILRTLKSIVENNELAGKIEILVVNDGSKDNTVGVVKQFIKEEAGNNCLIRLIDKENGGHGSTINVGIQEAHGKYLRIIDGDDWVNTKDLEKLIKILEEENSDIVLTDYSEDIYVNNTVSLHKKCLYDFMEEGKQYTFDDLYRNYGFGEWGPVMASSNIKLSKLRAANFKLSEKSFYVDMEFNAFYLPEIETITYYDLDIYRYYIGRAQQSTNIKTFSKSAAQHRKVIVNIINFVNRTEMSQMKKDYIYEKLIDPMLSTQYGYLLRTGDLKKLISFDHIVRDNISKREYANFIKKISVNKAKKTVKNAGRKLIYNPYTYKIATSRALSSGVGRTIRNTAFDIILAKRNN